MKLNMLYGFRVCTLVTSCDRIFSTHHGYARIEKICIEFDKRVDPQLPFYYYTSDHDHYYEEERPSFNKPTNHAS